MYGSMLEQVRAGLRAGVHVLLGAPLMVQGNANLGSGAGRRASTLGSYEQQPGGGAVREVPEAGLDMGLSIRGGREA